MSIVITGATSGVGRGAAELLASDGAELILLCRTLDHRSDGLKDFLLARGASGVRLVECDLGSMRSVRGAARSILDSSSRVKVLLNVAGILPASRKLTDEGIELTWATNVLGPALLTEMLRPRLMESAPARIVNISGNAHRRAEMNFDDPEFRSGWSVLRVSTQAALAKVYWTYALAAELDPDVVTANTFCPGFVRSRLTRSLPWFARPVASLAMVFAQSPQVGAQTPVHLATSPELAGVSGRYFRKMSELKSAEATYDLERQRRVAALIRGALSDVSAGAA